MDLSLDLFSNVEPTQAPTKTDFFASNDLFNDIGDDSDADLFSDITAPQSKDKSYYEEEDNLDDLFSECASTSVEDECSDKDEDLFSDEDLFGMILSDDDGNSNKMKLDSNPNTAVLYAVPGVDYGRPEDFPDITQIKERFLSELMSDL